MTNEKRLPDLGQRAKRLEETVGGSSAYDDIYSFDLSVLPRPDRAAYWGSAPARRASGAAGFFFLLAKRPACPALPLASPPAHERR